MKIKKIKNIKKKKQQGDYNHINQFLLRESSVAHLKSAANSSLFFPPFEAQFSADEFKCCLIISEGKAS